MLRVSVLVILLVNAGLFFWLQSEPQAMQSDREPQRVTRQVAPDAISVLPDLPASAARGADVAASAASAAGGASAPQAGASAATTTAAASGPVEVAVRATDTALDCSESTALDDAQAAALRQALAKAGVPAGALTDRRQSRGGTWAVYMGRYADSQAWQDKADQLKRLNIAFERVNTPAALAPGLSLGRFPSAAEAQRKLDELGKHGVHTARVVELVAPATLHFLQVRGADPAWRHATGAQRFNSCSAASAPTQL